MKEMCRTIGTAQSKSKRSARKIQLTNEEWSILNNKTINEGYSKPRDYIMALSSQDTIYGAMEEQLKEKMFIIILPIMTTKDMIEKGINVEENIEKLMRELDAYANAISR